ncbi:MAG TPA: hypothetical protein VE377_05615 [Candidatus Dormibacteraeota bacterium]|nr:hypothetical protein [Candidatus Dormibacteraeota bacterium]
MSSAPDSSALEVDLWPKARFETDLVTPVSILRRQAALLGEKTQQLVTAYVASEALYNEMTHYFRLVVPALDNYKYELFRVTHKVDQLYPLTGHVQDKNPVKITDQSDLVGWLKEVLSAESTAKRIDSLMAQAKG